MDLITKGFDMIRHFQRFAKLLHGLCVLVSGCEHAEWDGDAFGVFRVDHGGVDFGCGGEGSAALGG